ncbi:conserved exported hypothetical protein [Acinetobacter proteolyticus]|uniref:Adhesin n=1 Tax=Acinetobacter proteolyticus TaxID=1776741 RepID=A0A653K5Q9_9GAMM|nr:YadA-like family protein [Acinetobacter proteolyticus]VXA56094.1 conserved exported hypothetical protein [Acinetobacter proteolyticus]
MKKTFQLSIIAAALMVSHAYAAPVWEGPTGTGSGLSNAIGGQTNYANVPSTANGIILGQLNDVDNTSIGMGYNSNAMGQNGFAAGTNNEATGDSSIAISAEAHARGESSIAVGSWINANDTQSTAVGTGINVNKANSVAVGNSQNVYDENATAVGGHSEVRGNQSSSFGDWAWASGGNGATAVGSQTWANAENAITIGYNAETGGQNAVRMGAESAGSGLNSVVIGSHATGTAENVVQLGSGSGGAVGATAGVPGTSIADDKNSVAIGYGSDTQGQGASSENTVSVGGLLGGAIRRITQVADGVDNMDAINVSQLKREIAKIGVGAQLIDHADTLLTTEKTERIAGDKDLADKLAVEIAARQQVVDDEAKERANADIALSTAIGNEAKLRAAADDAEKDARIAGDAATKAERIEVVNAERDARILAINNEATLRANADAQETADRIAGDTAERDARIAAITNEATLRADADTAEKNARIAGDAMTKAERIAAVNAERDARIAGDTALAQRIDAEAATRKAEVNRLDGRLNQASRRLDDIEKSAYRGVAITLAAQQAVPNIRSGQVAVFAGVGHFEGETAGSVGLVTSFFASRVSLSGSVGYAGGNEVGSRIGLSYAF